MLRNILVSLAIAFLAACASIEKPANVGERIDYAYASLASVVSSTAVLAERGRINKTQAVEIRKQAKAAEELLILADFANSSGNPQTASEKLVSVNKILFELEKKLKSMETQ